MAANIIQGADKNIIVRINSDDTQDPYDLTGVSEIEACFAKSDGTFLEKFYLLKTGDVTSASDIITNIDPTNMSVGQSIFGPGIPVDATIIAIPNVANTVQISAPATATSTGATIEVKDVLILSPVIGKIKIQLHEADTNSLESGEGKNFEVRIVKNGFTSYLQFAEALNVVERYC